MKKLTPKEEEVMQALWKLKKAFVKEILTEMPNGKLHYNTVSTLVRKLEEKGFVGYEAFGKTHRYYPNVSKEAYSSYFMKNASQKFFDSSYKKMVSFFAQEKKISAEELREILEIIENKK